MLVNGNWVMCDDAFIRIQLTFPQECRATLGDSSTPIHLARLMLTRHHAAVAANNASTP
jgi:hypothetical protein